MRVKGFLKKNGSVILTVAACVGLVGTAVLVAIETPKAMEDMEASKGDGDTKLETGLVVARDYIPAIATAAATMACIISSTILDKKQQATILSAYASCNELFKNYREQVIERHGEEEDEEIYQKIVGHSSVWHQTGVDYPDIMALWYEPYTKNYIKAYEREILHAEYHINRNFMLGGYISVADWAMMLGISENDIPLKAYDEGWSTYEEYYWFDVTHNYMGRDKETGLPMFSLDTDFKPTREYSEGFE